MYLDMSGRYEKKTLFGERVKTCYAPTEIQAICRGCLGRLDARGCEAACAVQHPCLLARPVGRDRDRRGSGWDSGLEKGPMSAGCVGMTVHGREESVRAEQCRGIATHRGRSTPWGRSRG